LILFLLARGDCLGLAPFGVSMRFFFYLVIFLFVLSVPVRALANLDRESLAHALLTLKTGERGTRAWRECGRRLSGSEARLRASQYSTFLYEEHSLDSDFDPWIGAAIAMFESSLNRCAISRDARFPLERYLGHSPTEGDVLRLLRSRSFREQVGVGTFAVGLAQFRWPGVVASAVGVRSGGELVDARTNIRMLASSLRMYRETCSSTPEFRGEYVVNRDDGTSRTIRFRIRCADGYWVQHNNLSSFNYRYYRSVLSRHTQLLQLGAEAPRTIEGTEM